MRQFQLLFAALFVLCLAPADFAKAGDGFPPFGAWVYGRGHVPVAHRVRTVYRAHPFGWGGYATTRVHYGGFHRHHWHVHYRPWYTHRVGYPFFYYRPFPIYTVPVYRYPVYYSPICSTPTTVAVGYSVAAKQPVASGPALTGLAQASQLSKPIDRSFSVSAPDTRLSAKLVTTNVPTADFGTDSSIPAKLLNVADTLLRIGGHREAAEAYARLASKYGPSDLVYGRRFVAQATAGDIHQAEVVLQLAEATGFQISARDLPEGSLVKLLNSPELVSSVSEQLAKHALEQPDDGLSLRTVATWLSLNGDHERAAIFFKRSEQLEPLPTSPALSASKTVLTSFE